MKISTEILDLSRPVLVAISGGADSVALLSELVRRGYHCVAAHCNFHLRGADSDSDEAFVRSFCRDLGVELRVAQFDTRVYASEHKVSIEMAARELRYDWFFSLLDEMHVPVVAVAHHADDAAETFMLNLVRGTGIRGLSGMKSVQGRVARPMLGVSRHEIELYCKANGLKYVTDCTNASDDYARNRIRHHVIPELKALNPSFLSTMNQNMAHVAQVMEVFQAQVDDFRRRYVSVNEDGFSISIAGLRAQVAAEPFLFELLAPVGLSPRSVHDVARCVVDGRVGREFRSSAARVVVDRESVIVIRGAAEPDLADDVVSVYVCPAEVQSPLCVSVSVFDRAADYAISRDPMVVHFDADCVSFPLLFRHWRVGDSFRPLGMKGEKKLSDFFVDRKVSRPEKEKAWIAESDGRVIAVLGMRIDDRFKVTQSTRRIIEIRFKK